MKTQSRNYALSPIDFLYTLAAISNTHPAIHSQAISIALFGTLFSTLRTLPTWNIRIPDTNNYHAKSHPSGVRFTDVDDRLDAQ